MIPGATFWYPVRKSNSIPELVLIKERGKTQEDAMVNRSITDSTYPVIATELPFVRYAQFELVEVKSNERSDTK